MFQVQSGGHGAVSTPSLDHPYHTRDTYVINNDNGHADVIDDYNTVSSA